MVDLDGQAAANPTGVERIVGFTFAGSAEKAWEIYDQLNFREQLILDLLIEGWNQAEIGELLVLSQSSVSIAVQRIRVKLANTRLRELITLKMQIKDEVRQ